MSNAEQHIDLAPTGLCATLRSEAIFRRTGRCLAVFACTGPLLLFLLVGAGDLLLVDFYFLLAFLWAVAVGVAILVLGRRALGFLMWMPVAFTPPFMLAMFFLTFPAQH